MLIDNAIYLDRQKAVFLNVPAGSFKVFFAEDSELTTRITRHIIVITDDDFAPVPPPVNYAGVNELNSYVVNFLDHQGNVIIENMPILNLLPGVPFSSVLNYEELPQFKLRFDPQKSYISTATGGSFGQDSVIFLNFIFKDH